MKITITAPKGNEESFECESYELKEGYLHMKVGEEIHALHVSQIIYFCVSEDKK